MLSAFEIKKHLLAIALYERIGFSDLEHGGNRRFVQRSAASNYL
jgi:hypothetical protein